VQTFPPVHTPDVEMFLWMSENIDLLVVVEEKSGNHDVIKIYPLLTMNFCSKFHGKIWTDRAALASLDPKNNYLYMETFSMRSVVSVSVMMMPFGETVSVTFRNFLALALACGYEM